MFLCICTMEGRTEEYYRHRVIKESKCVELRINLTWRWIANHAPSRLEFRSRCASRVEVKRRNNYGCAHGRMYEPRAAPILVAPTRRSSVSRIYALLRASEEASMSVNELEWIPIDLVWDTGAVEHVADRVDIPGYTVTESEGSRRRQKF